MVILDQKLHVINEDSDIDNYANETIGCILYCFDRFTPENPSRLKKTLRLDNEQNQKLARLNETLQSTKKIKDPTRRSNHAFQKLRIDTKRPIRNAKREKSPEV